MHTIQVTKCNRMTNHHLYADVFHVDISSPDLCLELELQRHAALFFWVFHKPINSTCLLLQTNCSFDISPLKTLLSTGPSTPREVTRYGRKSQISQLIRSGLKFWFSPLGVLLWFSKIVQKCFLKLFWKVKINARSWQNWSMGAELGFTCTVPSPLATASKPE